MNVDVLVVGGGPAGLSAAFSASKNGAKVALIERENRLGGILNQCIHNGFGLHYFKEELTGPEYAYRWAQKLAETKVKVFLGSVVCDIQKVAEKQLLVTTENQKGFQTICAKSVILCMGCREKPAGAIQLCGTRPAGIFSAGEAQKMLNYYGKLVGKEVVILGSGDVGLIMARRLTCEGAKVVGVYEIMPKCGGLARNVSQCLNDFDIPLHLSTSIVSVLGKKRVEGVIVAPVNPDFSFDYSKKQTVKCDTVLLSIGLVPEVELVQHFNLQMMPATNSFVVNEYYQTSVPEIFACGNVMHVNDLVDNVTNEGLHAGECASTFANGKLETQNPIEIKHDEHIKYTVPKYVYKGDGQVSISFRVDKEYRKVMIVAESGGERISVSPHPVVRAGEMEQLKLDKSKIKDDLVIKMEVL